MKDPMRMRRAGRAILAVASCAFIAGAAVIVFGQRTIGDALMICGGAMLLVGAAVIARARAGGGDVG